MKLRNKKTGDVFDFDSITDLCFGSKIQFQATNMHNKPIYIFNSLAELNEEWEDYEDDDLSKIIRWVDKGLEDEVLPVSVNDFVEKLKAWKRLKDKGFRFTGIAGISNNISFEADNKYNAGHIMFDEYSNTDDKLKEYNDDLMLLFRSEE